jgi:hypothetical protein
MAQIQRQRYEATRSFCYISPIAVGDTLYLTQEEIRKYANMTKVVEPSAVSDKKETEVNDEDVKPNKKIAEVRGRRKNK